MVVTQVPRRGESSFLPEKRQVCESKEECALIWGGLGKGNGAKMGGN